MTLRKDTLETKRRILSVCVRLFLQQGYHATSISQIAAEAEVTGEPLPEKPVTMAIGEVAEGKYVSDPVIEEDEA